MLFKDLIYKLITIKGHTHLIYHLISLSACKHFTILLVLYGFKNACDSCVAAPEARIKLPVNEQLLGKYLFYQVMFLGAVCLPKVH